jgi:hypothetical protein
MITITGIIICNYVIGIESFSLNHELRWNDAKDVASKNNRHPFYCEPLSIVGIAIVRLISEALSIPYFPQSLENTRT